jgi:hypothetical protein
MKSSATNLGETWGRKTTKKNEELSLLSFKSRESRIWGMQFFQGLPEKHLAPGNSLPAMQGIISVATVAPVLSSECHQISEVSVWDHQFAMEVL